jgi:hypothetical protein
MKEINDKKFSRLRTAIDWSIRQLEIPRSNRVAAIRQFVGSHYAGGGSDRRMPTNLLELAVTIYVRQLAARAPRVITTTKVAELRPFAKNLELALNQIPDEIGLGSTIRRAVIEAIFGIGICKVGICESDKIFNGHAVGEPFVDLVSLDDYFCDMSAKDRSGIQYEGNDYWLPFDTAKEMYPDAMSDVEPDEHTVTGDNGESRADGISADEGADLYRDKVWLRDVFLPDTQQLLTYGVKSHKIFRMVDWDGPVGGPYHVLGFSDVPGNLLPLPMVALWLDLHELGNALFRKLAKQADGKKTVTAFAGGNDDDVNALRNAADGDGIRYNGQKPEQLSTGGIDSPTLAFFLQVRDLFSYFAGNLDTLGGLSPMTDTVGQDKLLSDAANARINYMRDQTIDFVRSIFRSLAWYEWTDPVRERIIEKRVKGVDIALPVKWSPDTREGDFLDYNIDIDVYSMQDDTPSLKLQKIGMALERFVFPALPMIEAQGGRIDFQKLLGMVGQLGNVPEIEEVVVFGDPPAGVPRQGGSATPTLAKPANTTRTYERVNRPGATRAGKDDVLSRLLMGGNVQDAEAASIGRRVS